MGNLPQSGWLVSTGFGGQSERTDGFDDQRGNGRTRLVRPCTPHSMLADAIHVLLVDDAGASAVRVVSY